MRSGVLKASLVSETGEVFWTQEPSKESNYLFVAGRSNRTAGRTKLTFSKSSKNTP